MKRIKTQVCVRHCQTADTATAACMALIAVERELSHGQIIDPSKAK